MQGGESESGSHPESKSEGDPARLIRDIWRRDALLNASQGFGKFKVPPPPASARCRGRATEQKRRGGRGGCWALGGGGAVSVGATTRMQATAVAGSKSPPRHSSLPSPLLPFPYPFSSLSRPQSSLPPLPCPVPDSTHFSRSRLASPRSRKAGLPPKGRAQADAHAHAGAIPSMDDEP